MKNAYICFSKIYTSIIVYFFVNLFGLYLLLPLAAFAQQAPGDPDQLTVNNNAPSQDFRGIKLGDVTTPAANPQNRPEAIVLRTADLPLTAGETVLVPVQVNGFTDLAAFQFVLRFDPQVLHFDEVDVPNEGILSASDFGDYLAAFGELRSAYAAANTSSVPDGSHFFTLHFTALQNGGLLSEHLYLDETELPAEGYTANLEPRPIQLAFVQSTSLVDPAAQPFHLTAQPNPAFGQTNLYFLIPQPGQSVIRITDSKGRTVQEHRAHYLAGSHSLPIELNQAGVYFASLQTAQGLKVVRIVVGE